MADNSGEDKPVWTPAFRDLIPDQHVVQEFDRLAAFLKTINGQTIINIEKQIEKSDPPNPNPDNPDVAVKPEDGIRWMKGPWLLNADNDTALATGSAAFYVSLSGGTYNDWGPDGIDNAVVVLIYCYGSAVTLTGIKRKERHARFLKLYNVGATDLKITNGGTGSNSLNRIAWGTSGDVGETITIPTGMGVELFYNPRSTRWALAAIPPVTTTNLPVSLKTTAPDVPFDFHWFASQTCIDSAGAGGFRAVFENTPSQAGTPVVITDDVGAGMRNTTAAVLDAGAGVAYGTNPPYVTGSMNGIWTTIFKTGSSLTQVRIWCVMTGGTTPSNVDAIASATIGFRYSTAASDPGWVGVCANAGGAAQTVSGKVADIAVDALYKLQVRKVGSSAFFSVNDGTEVEITTNLPPDATSLSWYCYHFTNEAVAKAMIWYRHHFRAALEP